jgi:hypothetical protein
LGSIEELEQAEKDFKEEIEKWNLTGLPAPDRYINFDAFHLVARFDALIAILLEKELLEENSFATRMYQRMAEMMKDHREAFYQAQAQAGKKILGPNGKPMH